MDKRELTEIRTIIFDYDGTLHDSTENYILAFKKAYNYLISHGKAEPRKWEKSEITQWLGYSSKDMWANFMPDLEVTYQQSASKIIGETLLQKVQANEAILFPGALETMTYLKKSGYRLVFLSNCRNEYMEAHRQVFQLDHYFEGMYCTESYNFMAKHNIFMQIKDKYEPPFLIVGDRSQDFEIGTVHQLKTIGCNYGYGTEQELQMADMRINDIRDLKDIL